MTVSIIDSITTLSEVCLLQAHNMNTIVDASNNRIFSDDTLSTIINNVIRFVYGNSREDLDSNTKLFCINTLSVIALNNIMFEAGQLPNYQPTDPFDKLKFYEMIETIKEDETAIDVVPFYRPPNRLY